MCREENNKVKISGTMAENFSFSHKVFGEKFFRADMEIKRASGYTDFIPVMVSERLIDVEKEWKGKAVSVKGNFRSYNKHSVNKTMLLLYVFALEFEKVEEPVAYENEIFLDGFICKEVSYRKTPLGREIADVLLAVNRPYGKSDYIPVVCWGRSARYAGKLQIGTRISIKGRIQSREYQKMISETEFESKVAMEVSVSKMEVIQDETGED